MKQLRARRGFTMIELLVVMAVIGLLLSIIAPRYIRHVDKAKEAALHQNLLSLREAIDKFYADKAHYPKALDELVQQHYIRQVPMDPITNSADTWVIVPATAQNSSSADGGIFNVKSGAPGDSLAGEPYAAW
jgi:general secretion pathway protein G